MSPPNTFIRAVIVPVPLLLGACSKEPSQPSTQTPITRKAGLVTPASAAPALPYPVTRRGDVKDDYFGTQVADPYRWLEDGKSAEVRAWVEAEDAVAGKYLAALPERDTFAARLLELAKPESVSAPKRRGGFLYFSRYGAGREHAVIVARDLKTGAEKIVLDPNSWPKERHESIADWWPSWDGKKLAYAVSAAAADESVLHVLDAPTGKVSDVDVIPGKYPDPEWTPAGDGFYYANWPSPSDVPVVDRPGLADIRFHRLGDDPKRDRIVHEKTGDPSRFIQAWLSQDGKWLMVRIRRGWEQNDLYVKDARDPKAPFRTLIAGTKSHYWPTMYKDRFYITTDEGASRFRAFEVDPRHLERSAWKEILPERTDATLAFVDAFGGKLVAHYYKDATSRLEIHELDGKLVRAVELPGLGTAGARSGRADDDTFYFAYQSFTTPNETRAESVRAGALPVFAKAELPIDPARYVTDQVFFVSKDGTRIPMFVVHRKDQKRDGSNRVLLTGYGGFLATYSPRFSGMTFAWLERGGVLAVANVRGGGEYGERWHQDGMLLKKQNVFDDFIGAATELVRAGWTSPGKIASMGESNGGLLVGATMTQRPDLFGAVLCRVPILDMLRYDKVGSGKSWRSEYGSAENAEQFRALFAYSPYHHVVSGTKYPALLVTTSDADDRVDPMHARKFVAAVQAASSGGPALLRISRNSGHMGAGGMSEEIARNADMLAFAWANTR